MERAVAVKKLRKLLGKEFGYQINPKAATREEREAAKAALPESNAERKRLEEQKRARCEAVLAADAEYQQLKADYQAAVKRNQSLLGTLHGHKITVGNSVAGMFFSVKAEGDSWEDVIEKLSKKKVPA